MKNCSLSLEEGKLLVILGKSGSGKSTLLRCVYGLEDLINGSISFKNETVLGPAYNLIPGYQSMKLVSQEYYVLDNHTVSENILDKLSGYADEYKQKRLNQLLRILNLLKVKNQIPKQLSSGQRQRVSIARALADFPELLLLDEPFSNLDLPLKDKIFEYIRKSLQQHQASAILVTHQPEEAMRYADIIAVMNEGKIIQYDLPQIIYYKPINTNVAALMGNFNLIDKADIQNSKISIQKQKQLFLRSDGLSVSPKNKADLQVTYSHSYFHYGTFEHIVNTITGKTISFYATANDFKPNQTIYLSIQSDYRHYL